MCLVKKERKKYINYTRYKKYHIQWHEKVSYQLQEQNSEHVSFMNRCFLFHISTPETCLDMFLTDLLHV